MLEGNYTNRRQICKHRKVLTQNQFVRFIWWLANLLQVKHFLLYPHLDVNIAERKKHKSIYISLYTDRILDHGSRFLFTHWDYHRSQTRRNSLFSHFHGHIIGHNTETKPFSQYLITVWVPATSRAIISGNLVENKINVVYYYCVYMTWNVRSLPCSIWKTFI